MKAKITQRFIKLCSYLSRSLLIKLARRYRNHTYDNFWIRVLHENYCRETEKKIKIESLGNV